MKKYSFIISFFSLLVIVFILFSTADVFGAFTNVRAEWQPCEAAPPQVPNRGLDLSWNYDGAFSNNCRITIMDSLGADWDMYDEWCPADVIEYTGRALIAGETFSWKVAKLDANENIIEESNACSFVAVQPSPLPVHNEHPHIRLFRNFPVVQTGHNDIVDQEIDLSFTDGTGDTPEHIALPYDLNTELMTPYLNDPNLNSSQYRKADKLKEWWCDLTGNPCTAQTFPENWFCDDVTDCDIPEDMFMHFKVNTTISLPLGNNFPQSGQRMVKGWDPANDIDGSGKVEDDELPFQNAAASARSRQEARIPSFYWGDYWRYLKALDGNPEPVNHRSNFAVTVGDPDYKEFMSVAYVPYVLSIKEHADGIYLDDATGAYYKIWQQWAGTQGFVEYGSNQEYLIDNMKLMKAIKENMPSGTYVIGNGWSNYPHIIDGNQKETSFNISTPYKGFSKVKALRSVYTGLQAEQNRGLIIASQFNPADTFDDVYYDGYSTLVPGSVARGRDQIYGLASYYLIAGGTTYFSYGLHPYHDWWMDPLFIKATGVDSGFPESDYYVLPGSEEYGQGVNLIVNGDFASTDGNNDPAGWIVPQTQHVEVASEEDCALAINGTAQGSCAKIDRQTTSHQWSFNTQWITLDSDTTYTLTGHIRTENVNNTHGANIFTYNFEVAGMDQGSDDHLDCGVGPGTNGWDRYFCTFTTETMPAPDNHSGQYGNGTINFRIQGGTGTAWFDNIELRQGVSRIVLARDYSNALMLVRPRAGYNKYYDLGYADPVSYNLNSLYCPVNADGSLGSASDIVTLNNGEAAILIKDCDGDGMSNDFEAQYGLDLYDPLDADDDNDGDGLTNREEFDTGTNPINPDTDGDGRDDQEVCPFTMPAETGGTYYATLGAAYAAATEGDTIRSQFVAFNETLDISRSITLYGGHDCDFSGSINMTTLNGKITISDGTVTIKNFILE